jgi:ubiquinone/menaquinone biosynthesis C-methylase UbiE
MDEISAFNQSKWDELAEKGVQYARPYFALSQADARRAVDPFHLLGDLTGKRVLCLASGGGQQTAAFHVLGAQVSVLDLSDVMLERDREVARHYNARIDIQQGDMRNLSRYPNRSFDVVWHAYSINFIPDPLPVFHEVARVLKPGGFYRIEFHNPFVAALDEATWNGSGYLLSQPYENGSELQEGDWEFPDENGQMQKVPGPRSFRHTLSAVLNHNIGLGFQLLGLWEEIGQDANAAPGTWEHFIRVAPPWITLWFAFHPK